MVVKNIKIWIRRKRVPWISELSGKNLTAAEPQKEETAGGSQLFLSVRQLDRIYTIPMTYTSPMNIKKQLSRATNIFLSTENMQLYSIKQ